MSLSVVRTATQTLRALARRPGYALTVVATVALGIGAATAVYALVHRILLSELPFPEAQRLVIVRNENPQGSWNTSVADLRAMSEATGGALESVAAMRTGEALVGSGEGAHWLPARYVTARYFDVLGVRPARGRGFVEGEDLESAEPRVVVGHALAERTFGAGADPIGRSIVIDGQAHTVVGVMSPGAESYPVMRAELWPVLRLATPERRGPFFLATLARLAPGASLERARAELEGLSQRMFPIWQQGFQDATARLAASPLHDAVVAGTDRFLWLAFAAVGVVLLIALANAANLVLMRIAQRRGDLGVRSALGAGRWRLAGLVLGENLWLVAGGAAVGIAIAAALLAQYRALGPAVPRIAEVALDANVLGFAMAVAAGAALALSLVPMLAGVLGAPASAAGARGASSGREPARLRDGLVVLEIALAVPLLIAAALLVESLVRLQRVDPGFDAGRLLTAQVRLPETYADANARNAFWARALPVLRAVPGVEDAATTSALPPACGCYNNFDLVDRPAADGNQPQSPWVPVDADYFALLGTRLIEGRIFDARDTPDSPPVLVVSRSWAERHFPGQSAVGRELHEGGDTSRTLAIVGVVEDVRYDGLEGRGEVVFAPLSQGWGDSTLALVVRTRGEPLAMSEPLRAALQSLDPALVPREVATMSSLLADAIGGQRHWAAVIAAFAFASLLLAAIGVFAVLAYHVAQRQREIGIRQALGADARGIVVLVLRRGLRTAALGVAIGCVLAAFATRGLAGLLHEVTPADPVTWLAACAIVLATGAFACWLPARRAARVDPLVALRHD